MFIRSNVLTLADIKTAFMFARTADGQDIYMDGDYREFRPRRFARGWQLWASASSGRHASAHNPYWRAASWDAYGYVMARLFAIDPDAQISGYNGLARFCDYTSRYVPRGMHAGFRKLAGCTSAILAGARRG